MISGLLYATTGVVKLDAELVLDSSEEVLSPASWLTPSIPRLTFTTLGFGDVKPVNAWGEFVVLLEVVSGYIGLGGLISILANKVARRA